MYEILIAIVFIATIATIIYMIKHRDKAEDEYIWVGQGPDPFQEE